MLSSLVIFVHYLAPAQLCELALFPALLPEAATVPGTEQGSVKYFLGE